MGHNPDVSRDGATRHRDRADGSQPGPGPDSVTVDLQATATAPRAARRALRQLDLPARVAEDGKLLVSELVTNSVRHAGLGPEDRIRLTAVWSNERLKVHVHSGRGSMPPPRVARRIRPPPEAESGWGLYLVERLASRWGTDPDGSWFELHHDQSGLG